MRSLRSLGTRPARVLALLAMLGALLGLLASGAPAHGAEQLVETLTVPSTPSGSTTGVTTATSYGTGELILEFSGSLTQTAPPVFGNRVTMFDALYCFASTLAGFCNPTDPSQGQSPSIRVLHGAGGEVSLGIATGSTRIPYSPSHTYRDTVFVPSAGPLTFKARPFGDPDDSVYAGSFEVKIFRTTAVEPPSLCPGPAQPRSSSPTTRPSW